MGTTAAAIGEGFQHRGGGPAPSPLRRQAAQALGGLWARHLWAWLAETGYRPERHHLRGGRRDGAQPPRPHPA